MRVVVQGEQFPERLWQSYVVFGGSHGNRSQRVHYKVFGRLRIGWPQSSMGGVAILVMSTFTLIALSGQACCLSTHLHSPLT